METGQAPVTPAAAMATAIVISAPAFAADAPFVAPGNADQAGGPSAARRASSDIIPEKMWRWSG
jgi:hypothetical protein